MPADRHRLNHPLIVERAEGGLTRPDLIHNERRRVGEVFPRAAKEVPSFRVFELSPEVAVAPSLTVDAPTRVDLQRLTASPSQVYLEPLRPWVASVTRAEVRGAGDEVVRYDRVGLPEENASTVRAKGGNEKKEAVQCSARPSRILAAR